MTQASTTTRLLAPDVARGVTLLGIAIANSCTLWLATTGTAGTLGGVRPGSLWDTVAVIVGAMIIHVRGLPMFLTLFGYGMAMLAGSLWRRGVPLAQARTTLIIRYLWLLVIGVAHMAFLFSGDIIVAYSAVALVFLAWFLPARTQHLVWLAAILLVLQLSFDVLLVVVELWLGVPIDATVPLNEAAHTEAFLESNYLFFVVSGVVMLPVVAMLLPLQVLVLAPMFLLGFAAGRAQIITHADRYRRLLWGFVCLAVAIMLGVGLPLGLQQTGLIQTPVDFDTLNHSLGMLTGPGILAGIVLATQPLQRRLAAAEPGSPPLRLPAPVRAVQALGQRSLSGYIAQSLIFVIVVAPYGPIGYQGSGGAARATAIGCGCWALTLCGAVLLARFQLPGPVEWLHRRLAYGAGRTLTPRAAAPASASAQIPPLPDNPYRTPRAH
ncbi:hypothetical protein C1Y63_03180 [Corynebacterium sp. 13CS0277]|uniref:DUF418 domain-containing protein n=1 Tax=Corynebacterium sp. 13CS0277 TaxID=2071994 RepID=UPI000D02B6FF|nr:DUF418 domain-containing protein [Corynebacterium sp. 13CS0277]PRQ12084.1 hypothetical protein C1Y63_03180 [Corynebacterium sp. 13CS0277]